MEDVSKKFSGLEDSFWHKKKQFMSRVTFQSYLKKLNNIKEEDLKCGWKVKGSSWIRRNYISFTIQSMKAIYITWHCFLRCT